MTTPAAADLKPARLRLWSNRLWFLAGLLGLVTLWSAARLIHDQRVRREALRSLARDKATEIANLGAARFSLLVANAFAPMWDDRLNDPRLMISELENAQTRLRECRCGRESLPITRFFRFDASTSAPFDAGSQRITAGAPTMPDGVADSTLQRIALRQFDAGMRATMPIRDVELIGQNAIVTITRPARGGPGTKVYGAVMPVAGLAATLFGGFPRDFPDGGRATPPAFAHAPDAHVVHMQLHNRLVRLDTMGLGVSAGSRSIFGTVADRPYAGMATLPEPLDDFRVHVALMGSQVALPLVMPFAHDRLWLNGILIAVTIIVCLFAIGASRREVALARARSDFVAGVSHDLRMPLAQILLAGETLAMGRERNDGERSALTASILREARRLKAMIDNVLLFSRSGAVGLTPNLHPFEAGLLLRMVAESLALAVADAGQTVAIEGEMDARVLGDRALLHQALANVVDNAMKYGPAGQCIRLAARRAGTFVDVSVEDEGPGIPASARERLFEPYERLARDATSERTGSGLGLAVARQIVLACNGTMRIQDGARGTRVVISLPTAR